MFFVVVVVVVQMILQKLTDLLVIFKRIPSFHPPTVEAIALFHFPSIMDIKHCLVTSIFILLTACHFKYVVIWILTICIYFLFISIHVFCLIFVVAVVGILSVTILCVCVNRQGLGFLGDSDHKKTCLQCRRSGFDPLRRKELPTPVFLPGEFHSQRAWQATIHMVQRVRHGLATIILTIIETELYQSSVLYSIVCLFTSISVFFQYDITKYNLLLPIPILYRSLSPQNCIYNIGLFQGLFIIFYILDFFYILWL